MALYQQIHFKSNGRNVYMTYVFLTILLHQYCCQAHLNWWFKTTNSHFCIMTVGL
jgi:hypothetical protein